jgi:hypothetical protein
MFENMRGWVTYSTYCMCCKDIVNSLYFVSNFSLKFLVQQKWSTPLLGNNNLTSLWATIQVDIGHSM